MKKRTAVIASCSLTVALSGLGIAAAAAPNSDNIVVEESTPQELSPQQQEVFDAYASGAPIGVVDYAGEYQGVIDTEASEARDDRILEQVQAGFREPMTPYDEEYERLWEALAVLDPIAVTDDDGSTVGYWTGHFITPEALEAAQAPARATVDSLLG